MPVMLALLLAPPLFWAGNAVVGRAMVGHISPMTLSFGRWLLAFLILLPFTAQALWSARGLIRGRWVDLVIFGVTGVGSNSLLYLALQTSTALNVTLIAAGGPVATLTIGALFFGQKVLRHQAIGALLSIAGVIWVIGQGSMTRIIELRLMPGDAWMLLAITAWSTYTWLLRTRRPDIAPFPLLTIQIGFGSLVILPFAVAEVAWGPIPLRFDTTIAIALVYVTLLPSLLAYFCWDRGVALAGPTLPIYFSNLTPLFTALLSVLLLGEVIASFHLIGALLIFLGIFLGNRR